MKTDKLVDGDLSYKVIGTLYKVHNLLGPLYQEKYYQRATAEELERRKIPFVRESSYERETNSGWIDSQFQKR